MIDSIRILGKRYKVVIIPDSGLDAKNQGHIQHQTSKISILKKLNGEQRRETLLHEVLHGIDDPLQLGMTEAQVGAMSSALWAVCQANPKKMRWILGLGHA